MTLWPRRPAAAANASISAGTLTWLRRMRLGPPTASRRPARSACTPWPGIASNAATRGTVSPRSAALGTQALGSGVRSVLPDPRGEPQCLGLPNSGRDAHRDDAMLPERQRTRLVEYHCVEQPRFLEASAIADKEPVLGA